MLRSTRAIASLTFAGLLLFGACGSDDGGETTDDASTSAESPAGEETAAGTYQVEAQEYAFTGIPDTIPAGETTFEFKNVGEELHEMAMFRIKTDATAQELLEMPEKKARSQIEEVGGTFAKQGKEGKPIEADLEPGRYAVVCFVPTGMKSPQDKPTGPPHFMKGMVHEFTVE